MPGAALVPLGLAERGTSWTPREARRRTDERRGKAVARGPVVAEGEDRPGSRQLLRIEEENVGSARDQLGPADDQGGEVTDLAAEKRITSTSKKSSRSDPLRLRNIHGPPGEQLPRDGSRTTSAQGHGKRENCSPEFN
jgi:hypothetical protein